MRNERDRLHVGTVRELQESLVAVGAEQVDARLAGRRGTVSRPIEPADRAHFGGHDRVWLERHGSANIPVVLHAITIRPVRLRDRPTELGCDRLRGVGYRAVCSCGYRSSTKGEHHLARAEGRGHLDGHAAGLERTEGLAGEPGGEDAINLHRPPREADPS